MSSAGIITTFAGAGNSQTFGSSGDNGAAASALLNFPSGVTVDSNGNVYFTDRGNNKVRMINSAGIISTVAGASQTYGSTGDGGPATVALLNQPWGITTDSNGNFYFADNQNNKIRMVNSAGIISTYAVTGTQGSTGDGGLAVSAQLNQPWGLAADGQNIYITVPQSAKVRLVNSAGI